MHLAVACIFHVTLCNGTNLAANDELAIEYSVLRASAVKDVNITTPLL